MSGNWKILSFLFAMSIGFGFGANALQAATVVNVAEDRMAGDLDEGNDVEDADGVAETNRDDPADVGENGAVAEADGNSPRDVAEEQGVAAADGAEGGGNNGPGLVTPVDEATPCPELVKGPCPNMDAPEEDGVAVIDDSDQVPEGPATTEIDTNDTGAPGNPAAGGFFLQGGGGCSLSLGPIQGAGAWAAVAFGAVFVISLAVFYRLTRNKK